ncbi:MAG: enoyl-CoA hydratase/isomerase family protein [Alphaproteobacteria bacterium]|jgi:enoyl-CoA hydratase/carnithine racemase|nr:enoyl-CoA hydratase/isomerase family protein [Alphaproteobacteria bacterium]
MAFEFVDLDVQGSVGWYRFNRAPRNSVHREMLSELRPAFEALLDLTEVRVAVIASAIGGYFSTGADVSTFEGAGPERMRDWVRETHRLAGVIRDSPKPVLAAINGIAVGGGLEMTLHADLRFVAADARLGQPEINIGFIPPVAGTQGLVRLVGRAHAFQMLYGGEVMDAKAAHEIGLADVVVPPENLESEVQAYGDMLARKPANVLTAIRRCLIDGGGRAFADGLAIEEEQAIALAEHENFQEGVTAFLEKRKPNWA